MNKSLVTLAAASALMAGVAFAQTSVTDTKTSTPGAGCTATGNAMAGGNLGGSPQNVHCGPTGSTTAATTGTTSAMPATAATTNSGSSYNSSSTASTTTTDNSSNMASSTPSSSDMSATPSKKTRVARADRG